MPERTEFFRKRTPIETIADAVRFLWNNFGPIFKGTLVIAGPILLLSTVVFSWYWAELETLSDPGQIMETVAEAASEPAYYVVALTSLLAQIVLAGTMYVFVVLYVENDYAPSIRELWSRFVSEIGTVLATTFFLFTTFLSLLLLNVIPCLGTIAFVALSFYLSIILFPLYPLRLWEPASLRTCVRRSFALVQPYFADSLVVLVLSVFVYIFFIVVLAIPATVMSTAVADMGIAAHVVAVVSSIFGSLTLVFPVVVSCLHVFNLLYRERQRTGGEENRYDPTEISERR